MVVHADFLRLADIVGKGVRSHRHDGDSPCIGRHGPDGRSRLVAIHVGHLDVHEYQVEFTLATVRHPFHGRCAIHDPFYFEPRHLQHVLRNFRIDRVVFHQQDALALELEVFQILERVFLVGFRILHIQKLEVDGDGKPRALSGPAFHLDVATHHAHKALRDGHAESRSLDCCRLLVVCTRERFEQVLLEILRHADAVVFKDKFVAGDTMGVGGPFRHRERDGPAIGSVLDGIAHQVHEHLLDAVAVADDIFVNHVRNVKLQGVVVAFELRLGHRKQRVHEFREVEIFLVQFHLARLDLVHVEHLVDERKQVARGFRNFLETVFHAFPVVQVGGRDCRHADNPVHGRTDVVAHARKEVTFRLAGGIRRVNGVAQHLLYFLVLAHVIVYILETRHNSCLAIGELHLRKLDTVVAFFAPDDALEPYAENLLARGVRHNVFKRQFLFQALPVRRGNIVVDVVRLGVFVGEQFQGLVGGPRVDAAFGCIGTEQRETPGRNIVDEPYGVVRAAQRIDDRSKYSLVRLHLHALFGNVRNEHVEKPAVNIGVHVMAVVVEPADFTVLADNSVFHVVQVALALFDLIHNGAGDLLVVVRIEHPLEGIARKLLELFERLAAENLEHGLVCVQQFLVASRLVNEKTARHVFADLLDNLQSLFAQGKVSTKHGDLVF